MRESTRLLIAYHEAMAEELRETANVMLAGADECKVLRNALSDLVGGMKSMGLAGELPGPFSRAETALNHNR